MLPPVTVAFFTFTPDLESPRTAYAHTCLDQLAHQLRYEGELRWHIADDGSDPRHADGLDKILRSHHIAAASRSNSERRGYGASYNAMTHRVHRDDDDLVLCVEDDWLLSKSFDLTPLVRAMEASRAQPNLDDWIKCVRLGYLGWTKELRGRLVRPFPGQTFLLLDPATPEHHVFSAGPRLETVRYERQVGLWREHCPAGEAEVDVASRSESRYGVAWPLDQGVNAALDNPSLFAHIGTVSVKDEPVA